MTMRSSPAQPPHRGVRTTIALMFCGAALLALVPQFAPTNGVRNLKAPSKSHSRRLEIDLGDIAGPFPGRHLLVVHADDEMVGIARKLLRDYELPKEGVTDEDERRALEVAADIARVLAHKTASMQHRPDAQKDDLAIAVLDDVNGKLTFPACQDMFIQTCENIIRKGLRELGFNNNDFKMEHRTKRDENDERYNRVVIVTNLLADAVAVEPTYPYQWNGRSIGGWACLGETPESCCSTIKADVPDKDATKTDASSEPIYIQCEITVPDGGVGNVDAEKIIINDSLDGRVHELVTNEV